MHHVSEDVLESFELGLLSKPAVVAVEEHLLICEACTNLFSSVRTYVAAMRAGLRRLNANVVFWQLHLTEDGLIEIWVEQTPGRRWLSRRQGRFYDGGTDFAMKTDALRESIDNFARLFPEHVCGRECLL